MSTTDMIKTWDQAEAKLRDYEPAGPEAIAAELAAARVTGRRSRRNFSLFFALIIAATSILAWVWRDDGDLGKTLMLVLMAAMSLSAGFALLSMLFSVGNPTSEERAVSMKYAPADGADWAIAQQMVEQCPEAREAVSRWLQRLPHLRRAEIDVLKDIHTVWLVEQARRKTMEALGLPVAA